MDRRTFLAAGGALLAAHPAWAATRKLGVSAPLAPEKLREAIAAIEKKSGGRLGVAMHDSGTDRRFAYRGDERFAMLSTFKLLLAGAVLARVQQGKERLDRRLNVRKSDIQGWSPFATRRAGGTASVAELCAAMTVESDNGAANLMLAAIGGPPALTAFLRQIGDGVTRLDRNEPTLNEARPGDPRDTTTPRAMQATAERLWLGAALAPTTPSAMLGNGEKLWLGPVLTPAHRTLLLNWAIESRTGLPRLRAGLPSRWRAGSKTGTGDHGSYNDVAIFWPPSRKPVVVACYLTDTRLEADAANAIHAQVARALVTSI